jgi:uncharacterized protein (DUF1778 family)
MATKERRRPAGPRGEHPVLIALSNAEALRLQRAADACDMKRAAFMREASLEAADEVLAPPKKGGRK